MERDLGFCPVGFSSGGRDVIEKGLGTTPVTLVKGPCDWEPYRNLWGGVLMMGEEGGGYGGTPY